MLVRLMVSCAIVCGVIASGSVVLADSASARTFKGKTAQGHQLKANVKGGKFKLKLFKANLKCRDGSSLVLTESGFLWTKVKRNGSFRDAQFGKTDSVYFRGKLKGKRLQGRVRLTDKLKGGVKCSSRWISFNAKPR